MQIKTIEKVILNKMNEWLETITDENLRKETRENLLVSVACMRKVFSTP